MKKTFIYTLFAAICFLLGGCKENYSRGEKVGNLIEFTKKGVIYDSWEGRLNLTQTGMNTSGEPFSFSFDNDRTDQDSLGASRGLEGPNQVSFRMGTQEYLQQSGRDQLLC